MSKQLQAHGVPVVDLDVLARVAVEPDSYALGALVAHFGNSILKPDGSLNREKLGQIVFGNERERKVLNSIVHPAVRRLLVWELVKAWLRGEKVCVVDAPLLIEAGLWKMCGAIVVVYWFVPSSWLPSCLESPLLCKLTVHSVLGCPPACPPARKQFRDPAAPAPPVPERPLPRRRPSAPLVPVPPLEQARLRRLRHRQLWPDRGPLGPGRPRRRKVKPPRRLELDPQLARPPRRHHPRGAPRRVEAVLPKGRTGQETLDARRAETGRDRDAG